MWSDAGMPAQPPPPRRPTRRSLLLSGAVLVPLGLAACDPEGEEEPPPPPRAGVTLEPMATSEDLRTEHPVRNGYWSVSATGTRPVGMLVRRERAQEMDLWVITLEDPAGVQVPVDPATTEVSVDGHGDTVRVLAGQVVERGYRYALWHTQDLVEWAETEIEDVIPRAVAAFGDGIAVSTAEEGTVLCWEVSESGAAAPLTSLAVQEGESWKVQDVAWSGTTIVLLVMSTSEDGTKTPMVIASEDSGSSWGRPQRLPTSGENSTAGSVRTLEGAIVIIGSHDTEVSWDEEYLQSRPTAWSSPEGRGFVQEEIPLPQFGTDGWSHDDRGELSAGTPLDFWNIEGSSPVVDLARGLLHLGVHFGDDSRRATRTADGRWSITALDQYAPFAVWSTIATPVGFILLSERRAYGRRGSAEEFTEGPEFSPARICVRGDHDRGAGVDAVLQSTWLEATRDESSFRAKDHVENLPVSIGDDGLEAAPDFPEEARSWTWGRIHRPADGVEIVTGRAVDDDGVRQLLARTHVGGSWTETDGLEMPGLYQVGSVREIDGVLYLPASASKADSSERGVGDIAVHVSEDGVTWVRKGEVAADSVGPESAGGGYVGSVVAVDGTLVGIGAVWDEQDVRRAATFVLGEKEIWTPRLVAEAPAGSSLAGTYVLNGATMAHGTWGEKEFHGTLAADGTCEAVRFSSDQEQRDEVIDLGEGALLAGGWVNRAPAGAEGEPDTGHGACMWASPDGGETWTATVLPGQEGRYPQVHLARDGEDVVVLADAADAPLGYRIAGAGEEILSAIE